MRDYDITSLSMTPFTHAPTIYTPTRAHNFFLLKMYDSEKLVVLVYINYVDIVPSFRS